MKTITYNVPNIKCMHCVHTIKTELLEFAGVKSVEADAFTKKVVIEFEDPVTTDDLENALSNMNYPVKE